MRTSPCALSLKCESIGGMERPINEKRVVLAGGSGFLGGLLARELLARNYEVVVLTRSPRERNDGVREAEWSGTHIGEWIKFLDGVDAVVESCRTHQMDSLRGLEPNVHRSDRAQGFV